ncbi:MAG: glycoside hydrolase family 25 protein [Lachnospiraceae bacterium]|nr:glycoside hydrolase family 25 protein [Lachnospiraceae bacterium]
MDKFKKILKKLKENTYQFTMILVTVAIIFLVVVVIGNAYKRFKNSKISENLRTSSSENAATSESSDSSDTSDNSSVITRTLETFMDAEGSKHEFYLDNEATMVESDKSKFELKDGYMTYNDDGYETKIGIDVSFYQNEIDWEQVKEAGIDFAFIRVGYRGYSEGKLMIDDTFEQNYAGAKEAGIEVGLYIFSQAINEDEAREEAKFCVDALDGRELDYPIIFDPESILHDEARTDDVTKEQFTANTLAFCDEIEKNGYESGLYANLMWQAYMLNMAELKDVTMWFADYSSKPQTPYAFKYWQYSCTANVPGVPTECDINIELIPNE